MRHALRLVVVLLTSTLFLSAPAARGGGKKKSVKAVKAARAGRGSAKQPARRQPRSKKAKVTPRKASGKKAASRKASGKKKASRKTSRKRRLRAKKSVRRKTKRRRRCRARGKDRFPPMTLFHANRRKTLKIRLFDRCGRANRKVPTQISNFLRCYRTKQRKSINWRLISTLYRVSRAFKGRRLIVYSGFRSRRVAKLKHSYHTRGRAIDFRVEGVSRRKLRDYVMKRFKKVGVGFYPNTPFIHMDVRDTRSAFWVDFSSSGEDSRYAKNPYTLLRNDRRGVAMKEPRRLWLILRPESSRLGALTAKKPTVGVAAAPSAPVSSPEPLAPLRLAPVAPIPPLPPLPQLPSAPAAGANAATKAPALTASRE